VLIQIAISFYFVNHFSKINWNTMDIVDIVHFSSMHYGMKEFKLIVITLFDFYHVAKACDVKKLYKVVNISFTVKWRISKLIPNHPNIRLQFHSRYWEKKLGMLTLIPWL